MDNNKYEMYSNDVNYTEWFEEFKEYCNDNDIDSTQYDEYSDFFHQWVYDTLDMYWEDFVMNLKHDRDNNVDCVVVADLGLWYGRRNAVKHFSTLLDAIYACIGNCDYITINNDNGTIEIIGVHHDGRNYFTIHKLNEKGYDAHCEDEDLDNEEYFDKFNIQW